MLTSPRHFATGALIGLIGIVSFGCGSDHTEICVGPGCPDYDGAGGSRTLQGNGGTSAEPVDAGTIDAGGGGAPEGGAPEPCTVSFVSPAAPDGGDITLVGGEDADGEECGPEFTARVSIASNGSTINLFVNDSPLGARPVDGPITDILAVLGNRGATPNALRVEATMADGRTCSAAFAADILVDCTGPSCSIQSPVAVSGYLNQSHDGNAGTAGLQTDVVVRTEAEHAGEPVRLEIDNVFLPDAVGAASGADSLATFAGLTLNEGERVARAECRDTDGNVTFSTPTVWQVDVTPCTIDVTSVAGGANPITPAQDADSNLANGIQVNIDGQLGGDDCRILRLGEGQCDSNTTDIILSSVPAGGNFSEGVTIGAANTTLTVCGRIIDAAGNPSGLDSLSVSVRLDAPGVAITSPADSTQFNVASGCDTTVEATCTEINAAVELLVDGTSFATPLCPGSGTLSIPVTLPTKNDGAATVLTVRQTAAGFPDAQASVSVLADCQAPAPTISAPICGSVLVVPADDENPALLGLQSDVTVQNDGTPAVTLTVTRGASSTSSTVTGDAISTSFPDTDLGGTGSVTLQACATDTGGNAGCSASCALTIQAEPVIAIASPAANSILTTANTVDCDPGTLGLHATISGTSDATAGSTVQVGLGAGAPVSTTVAGGTWSVCIPAPDGDDQTLTASVVDSGTNLTGTASITISVDTTPSGSVAAPTFTVTGRREGFVDLNWLSVLDSDGDALATYRLRCAQTDITSEVAWAAATDIPVSIAPASTAGATETLGLTNFETGMRRFCVVRGEDSAGNLSPIAAGLSTLVDNPFLSQTYTVVDDPNTGGFVRRVVVEPLGDINGDTIPDFAYGATQRVVQIFFGKSTLGTNPTESPDFELTFGGSAINSVGFGSEVAGIGDVNGDDIPDFAVGAPGQNAVFVFFGRSADTWTSIDVDANTADGCEADVCIFASGLGGTSGGLFGWDITGTNVDGAGPNDLVIAARTANTVGRTFVLLGGTQLSTVGSTLDVQTATLGTNPDGFVIDPPAARSEFGFAIDASGNNLVIAAAGAGGGNPGAVFVLPPQTSPTPGSGLTPLTAPALIEIESGTGANFGLSIRGVGDYDGDGFEDFATSQGFTAGTGGGNINLYRGSATGFSSASKLIFANNAVPFVDDNYGTFLASGGRGDLADLDGDNVADLLIGATVPDSPVGSVGSAALFYGAPAAVARGRAVADFRFTSTLTSGQVVPNFVGDVNDDGFNDVIILDSGAQANRVFLLF